MKLQNNDKLVRGGRRPLFLPLDDPLMREHRMKKMTECQ